MSVYTRQDLSVMQAWPLERKVRVTQAKIIEWYFHYGGNVAISFSGGLDSKVILDLARRAFPDIRTAFVSTGMEYPEIMSFVRTVPNVGGCIRNFRFPRSLNSTAILLYPKKSQNESITAERAAYGRSRI